MSIVTLRFLVVLPEESYRSAGLPRKQRRLPITTPARLSAGMTGYVSLLPTVFIVLAAFGGLFVVVAALLHAWAGPRFLWQFWAAYLVIVSASCVYKLSGLRFGVTSFTAGRTVYLAVVAIGALGVPLALAALVLARLSSRPTPRSLLTHSAIAWSICIAATPIAVLLVAIIDRIYASV